MNCSQARTLLPDLAYECLEPLARDQLHVHVAACSSCQRELMELQELRRLMDAAPAPAVTVDVPRLYREALARQHGLVRRWRRAALAGLAAAAALVFVILALHVEIRIDAGQAVVRWDRPPAAADAQPDPRTAQIPHATPVLAPNHDVEIQVLSRLIHALSADVDARDRRLADELARLQQLLVKLHERSERRLTETENSVHALYAAQFALSRKGDSQ